MACLFCVDMILCLWYDKHKEVALMINKLVGVLFLIVAYFSGKATYGMYITSQTISSLEKATKTSWFGMDVTILMVALGIITLILFALGIKMIFKKI